MAGIGKAHLRDKKDALLQVENLVVDIMVVPDQPAAVREFKLL